jgi:hypothetical protein
MAFRSLFAQLTNNQNEPYWAEHAASALFNDFSKQNCSLVNKHILNTHNFILIKSIVSHKLTSRFQDHLQGWIQIMINSLNRDESHSHLEVLVYLLCDCQKEQLTFNHTMIGKTFVVMLRMLKKNINSVVLFNVQKMLIAFPNPSKPHAKELQEIFVNQLSFLNSENIAVLIIECLICISKLEGKNVHVMTTQQLLSKILVTCHYLLSELTGGLSFILITEKAIDNDEKVMRFPVSSLSSYVHLRLPGITKYLDMFTLCLLSILRYFYFDNTVLP